MSFHRRHSSTTDGMHAKIQSDTIIWTINLAPSRLHVILRYDVLTYIETGRWLF